MKGEENTAKQTQPAIGVFTVSPTLANRLDALDSKPGQVHNAHAELEEAITVSHNLLEELVIKIQPVLNTTEGLLDDGSKRAQQNYGTPIASWISHQTGRIYELNDKLRDIIKLTDI